MSKSKDLKKAAVTYKKTGKILGVSASTVHRWIKQYEETGINSCLYREYGYAPRGQKIYDKISWKSFRGQI